MSFGISMGAISLTEALLLLPSLSYAFFVWKLGSRLPNSSQVLASSLHRDGESTFAHSPKVTTPNAPLLFQSVIIAARNEEDHLRSTLDSLLKQSRPVDSFEVIVVNDRSSDGSAALLEQIQSKWEAQGARLVCLENPTPGGKKRAITLAAEHARGEFISVLDADCVVGKEWLNTLGAAFEAESDRPCFLNETPHEASAGISKAPVGLVAAPARFTSDASLFQKIVRLEYIGLLGAGLASIESRQPLFASGANLSWRKSAFLAVGGYQGLEHIQSADDTLLIQRLHLAGKVRFKAVHSADASIETRGPISLGTFWRQRVRWSSTELSFEDKTSLLASFMLYYIFLGCTIAPLAFALSLMSFSAALLFLLLKLLPDLRLTLRAARLAKEDKALRYFPLVWLGQLAYGLLVPWFGSFSSVRWREKT